MRESNLMRSLLILFATIESLGLCGCVSNSAVQTGLANTLTLMVTSVLGLILRQIFPVSGS
jgi:hypothetical protein